MLEVQELKELDKAECLCFCYFHAFIKENEVDVLVSL
jgi:hypothetical protein